MKQPLFKQFKKIIIFSIFLLFFSIYSVQAGFIKQETFEDMQDDVAAEYAGYEDVTEESILDLVQTVINAFLSIVGVLLLIYMLYAGYNWMTAQGEEEKVTKAKDTLRRAIIGIIIIVAAYAISIFVMGRLEAGTLKGGVTTPAPYSTPLPAPSPLP